MSVTFDQIPSALRVPSTYLEVDGSRALSVPGAEPHRVLLLGTRLSTGSAAALAVVLVPGENAGDALFGAGSQLAQMSAAFKRVNGTAQLYALPVDENVAGTAATGTFALTGTATKDGTLTTRIGDVLVSTAAPSGTTAAQLATAHAANINATPRLPVTAAAGSGTITLTARHKGTGGNDVTIESTVVPAGITSTDTQPAGGATNPVLSAAIAAIDEQRYDTIITAFTDSANLALLENEMARRWGPLVKKPGMVIGAIRGTLSALTTIGAGRNSQFSVLMGTGLSPTVPWVWAAQVAARDAQQCDTQPNRPRNGLVLPDCAAPKRSDELDLTERNTLLYDGISTFKVDASGRVSIERLITTYRVNNSGVADPTYLSIETLRNLAHTYLEFLSLGSRHDRDLLGPDGTAVSPGVPLTTPKTMRGELVALYRSRIRRGLAKDLDGFTSDLIVEIDETNPERLNVQAMPRLVGGLVVFAAKLSFQL